MHKPLRPVLLLILAALVALPAVAQEEWSWSGRLAPGQTIEIKNANGPLEAELASGDEVRVYAIKDGPRRQMEEVRIELVEHQDGVTICALYPDGWFRDNSCEPGDHGRISSDDSDVEVSFRIEVPEGVELVGKTMNGAIDIGGLRSDVEVLTMNGRIAVETTGYASAKTMNGRIEVAMGSADWSGDMEIETMNGSIEIRLPEDANVELDASTMNGSIDSDFPVELSGWLRNKARGTIGNGGRSLDVSTMNGSIRIRRS